MQVSTCSSAIQTRPPLLKWKNNTTLHNNHSTDSASTTAVEKPYECHIEIPPKQSIEDWSDVMFIYTEHLLALRLSRSMILLGGFLVLGSSFIQGWANLRINPLLVWKKPLNKYIQTAKYVMKSPPLDEILMSFCICVVCLYYDKSTVVSKMSSFNSIWACELVWSLLWM